MRFPLRDWIESHSPCRYDLAASGMRDAVPSPPWPLKAPPPGVVEELHEELADHLGVARERLFLARGATEANAWVLGYLARELKGRTPRLRVRHPEYPPLFDTGRMLGFSIRSGRTRAEVAAVSQPRNPEGDLWTDEELARWSAGTRRLVVDETFREFAGTPSRARRGQADVWTTGSFTKFFGADDARVGFVVTPPEATGPFARYVGLVSDDLAPASAAIALALLRRVASVRRAVDTVVQPNLAAFERLFPGTPKPKAPLFFDRPARPSGRRLALKCLRASVLVCPGEFFGDGRGVRICLTRRNAPAALRRYVEVRGSGGRGT